MITSDTFRTVRNTSGDWLCIKCSHPGRVLEGMKPGVLYDVEIKQHRERRSKSANSYSWVLTDKLSDEMVIRGVKLGKDAMHAEMIFRYGQLLKDENGDPVVLSTAQEVPVPDFYPYAKPIGESGINGKVFTHYRIYRESHTYDTREFTIFLNGIIEECKEQGIETLTPAELARLEGYDG